MATTDLEPLLDQSPESIRRMLETARKEHALLLAQVSRAERKVRILEALASDAVSPTYTNDPVSQSRDDSPPRNDPFEEQLPPLEQPPHRKKLIRPESTTYRVAQILAVTRTRHDSESMLEEFKRRGWNDEDWSTPRQVMYNAMARATEYGWAKKVTSSKFETTL